MKRIRNIHIGLFKKTMIISLILMLLLHFNIEKTVSPLAEEDPKVPFECTEFFRTGTRAGNVSGEGNFTPHRSHIRTFINWGGPDEFIAEKFDVYLGKGTNMKTLNPNGMNFKYSFLGFVDEWEKTLLLPDYAAEHGLTDNDIENMYIHAKEDVYYTLGEPKEIDPKVTKLVPGWDPANDPNDDHYIDDTEFANRVNTNATARYKNESRVPIYYWGPPTDWQINPGDPNYQDFILWYFDLITEDYDGLYIDTMHLAPTLQGDTIVTEYPDLEDYAIDIKNLLTRLMNQTSKPAIGNGWYANYRVSPHPYIIDGVQYENWEKIITPIPKLKLDRIAEVDNMGKMQLIQHLPIYHEVANPDRPDFYVEGITLERDQIYGLSLYYLVHGDHTYFGYGCHGGYHLGPEKWFDAVDYDVGQPLGSYYIFDDSSGYTKETDNILVNGDFEIDDNGDGNPDNWVPAEPVELDYDVKYEGNSSSMIHSVSESNNNINFQSVTLEPYTTYTVSGRIKTENVTGYGAQIYVYDFNDLQECDPWIKVMETTDWTFYCMSFTTGSDTEGNIKYRIHGGTGTAWFDDFHLTEGDYDKYTILARDFENALVLLKPEYKYEDSTTSTHVFDGNYRPLRANGTLGTSVSQISLEDGEGAILVRENIPRNQTFLRQGWNLISVPLSPSDFDLDMVLSSITGSYDAVRWYDVTESSDRWKHSYIQKPQQLNDLEDLDHRMGFWIHISKPGGVLYEYSGDPLVSPEIIPLVKGWNAVGWPSLSSHDRETGLNNLGFGTEVDAIQWYDANDDTWHSMGPEDHFVPGRGYWMHSIVDTTWEVLV
jgi:hypothetical protein